MISAIVTFFLGLTGTLPMATPVELASYTKCQPDNISHWIGQRIDYERTKGWESAETCMTRGIGDCKCMAVVAEETLNSCAGMSAWIVILQNQAGGRHAVTFFTDSDGKKGFIDAIHRRQFPPEADWSELVGAIGGGQWTVVEQRHASNKSGGDIPPSQQGDPATVATEPEEVIPGNVAEETVKDASAPPPLLPSGNA